MSTSYFYSCLSMGMSWTYCRWILTCAHKSGRVRIPPSICSTHCPHPPSWDKPWVASEKYLSSLSCVLIWINGTIHRRSGITTVDWRAKSRMKKWSLTNIHSGKRFANFAVLWLYVKVFSVKLGVQCPLTQHCEKKTTYFSPIRKSFLPRKFPAIRYRLSTG